MKQIRIVFALAIACSTHAFANPESVEPEEMPQADMYQTSSNVAFALFVANGISTLVGGGVAVQSFREKKNACTVVC